MNHCQTFLFLSSHSYLSMCQQHCELTDVYENSGDSGYVSDVSPCFLLWCCNSAKIQSIFVCNIRFFQQFCHVNEIQLLCKLEHAWWSKRLRAPCLCVKDQYPVNTDIAGFHFFSFSSIFPEVQHLLKWDPWLKSAPVAKMCNTSCGE